MGETPYHSNRPATFSAAVFNRGSHGRAQLDRGYFFTAAAMLLAVS